MAKHHTCLERELPAKRKHDKVTEVKVFPPKKCSHPLLIGVQLDDRVKIYVKEIRQTRVIIM